jgi:hypothetical protein
VILRKVGDYSSKDAAPHPRRHSCDNFRSSTGLSQGRSAFVTRFAATRGHTMYSTPLVIRTAWGKGWYGFPGSPDNLGEIPWYRVT